MLPWLCGSIMQHFFPLLCAKTTVLRTLHIICICMALIFLLLFKESMYSKTDKQGRLDMTGQRR